MANQTQFYTGNLLMANGSAVASYPCLPNARLSWPKNYAIPPILGNYWQFNYVEGLRLPTLEIDLVPRDVTGEVLSGANNSPIWYCLHRNASDVVANDTPVIDNTASITTTYQGIVYPGSVVFSNGRKALKLIGAKVDALIVAVGSKGDDLRIRLRIAACACVPLTGGNFPGVPSWSSAAPIRFQSANFFDSTGAANILTNAVTSFTLTYSNNSSPDPSLNGTTAPAAINAGLPTCSLALNVQAATLVDQSLDNTAISLALTSPNGRVGIFTLNNILNATPDELIATAPRVLTPHQFIIRGADSNTTPPLIYSSTSTPAF